MLSDGGHRGDPNPPAQTGRSRLVFTSAGPGAAASHWLHRERTFDLWVADYGGCDPQLVAEAEWSFVKPGAKFPNVHHAWRRWPDLVGSYDRVLVLDDDIEIAPHDIDRLFDLHERFDLWIAQPAYEPDGKIAHALTCVRPLCILRYTNFVEVTAALFRRDKLEQFLAVYDPRLVGYGVDWWFCEVIGAGRSDKIAILDAVTCLNPEDAAKGGERSIDRLQPRAERAAMWGRVREERGLVGERAGYRTYGCVRRPLTANGMRRAAAAALHYRMKRARSVLRRYGEAIRRTRRRYDRRG